MTSQNYLKTDKYDLITQKLITLLSQGKKPWVKPWSATPYGNLITGNDYRGINPLICCIDTTLNEWEHPFFIGFKQAQEKGWKIRKGSKATYLRWGGTVVIEEEDKQTGKKQQRAYNTGKWFNVFNKWFNVFNVDCFDDTNADDKIASYLKQRQVTGTNTEPRLKAAEALIEAQQAQVSFGGNCACYIPSLDKIRMPHYQNFSGAIAYYATYLHEFIHWTGHRSRLNREKTKQFGSCSYAFEELIAEIGASFVCGQLHIESQLENHASYISNWLEVLQQDKQAFFRAAQQAIKAANWLLTPPHSEATQP
ncbi:ArdC family protein [Myxosarcina sp. GI1]|uniref:ArdC family protein n=1 Tax=Myxosarcina sp. GI1 TaxID=1541065 RepID=UPI0005665C60|nr:zincin-like metallopeptidase domain-containing protein [Myxosarcina sp. GI1]